MKGITLTIFIFAIIFTSSAYGNYKDIPSTIMNDQEVNSLITSLSSKGFNFSGLLENGFVTGDRYKCSCYDYSLYFYKAENKCYLRVYVVDGVDSPTKKPIVQDIDKKLKCYDATYSKLPEPTTTINVKL